jgi:hypothetical protein
MGKTLNENQLGAYQQQGFLFPLPVLSDADTAILRANWKTWRRSTAENCRLASIENRICC